MQVSVRVRCGAAESRAECGRNPIPWTVVQKIMRDVFGSSKTEETLERAMGAVRYFVKAPAVAMLRPDRGSRSLRPVQSVGLSSDFGRAYRVRVGEGAEGVAFRLKRPAWVVDIHGTRTDGLEVEAPRRVLESEGIRAIVGAPLRVHGGIGGVLAGYYPGAHPFTAEEVGLLGVIGDVAGLAVRQGEEAEAALEDAALTGARQLAATLSHEINTPLATVLGTIKLLLRRAQTGFSTIVPPERAIEGPALASIRSAGEEIAEVLQRVRRIHRYRTTEYVGGQRMIDLDAAVLDGVEDGLPQSALAVPHCLRVA